MVYKIHHLFSCVNHLVDLSFPICLDHLICDLLVNRICQFTYLHYICPMGDVWAWLLVGQFFVGRLDSVKFICLVSISIKT